MCGIAGLWAPGLGQAEQRHYVEAMLDHLMHRGPDGAVVWAGSGITLGLARLAIVAPDHPVTVSTDETGTIAAVANAELYNYREIQDRLAAGGHCIGTGPDTTALAHLYEELGAELPLALDGMFAIAVWDGRTDGFSWHVIAREKSPCSSPRLLPASHLRQRPPPFCRCHGSDAILIQQRSRVIWRTDSLRTATARSLRFGNCPRDTRSRYPAARSA